MSKPDENNAKDGPVLFGGLTLEQYAEIAAHLLHFSERDQTDVLARFGFDDGSFRVVEWGFRIALIEETMQFRTRTLKTFTKTVKATRRRLEDERPELEAVGTPMRTTEASSDDASSDAPAAESLAPDAEAVEENLAAERPPDLPTYVIAKAQAALAPPERVALPTSVVVSAEVRPPAIVVHPPAMEEEPAAAADEPRMANGSDLPSAPEPSPAELDGSNGGQDSQDPSVSALTRLETVTFEVPPEVSQLTGDVLPFKSATGSDAPAAPPNVDVEGEPPLLRRTRTVFANPPVATKALPFESPIAAEARDEPEQGSVPPGGPSMAIEQYASLCAELAVDPARSGEIEKRYGLSGNTRRELDADYSERFGKDPALQAEFKQLSERFRAWLVKSGTTKEG